MERRNINHAKNWGFMRADSSDEAFFLHRITYNDTILKENPKSLFCKFRVFKHLNSTFAISEFTNFILLCKTHFKRSGGVSK